MQVGTERRFKVEWEDEYPSSWEAEEHLPADLITLFQQQNPGLFQQRVDAATGGSSGNGGEWRGDDADWEAAAAAADGQAASGSSAAPQHSDGYRTQYSKV
jgi:signal recognition particle protein